MKLLFDQNLSHRLVALLANEFPNSRHVRECGLTRAADEVVWSFSAAQGFAIVSKDADFQQRALLLGHPPKVVWVRLGNCVSADVADLLRRHQQTLLAFAADLSASLIALA